MKVKTEPDDFQVVEESLLAVGNLGPFLVCRLEKRGWNTVDALRRIAREAGLPFSAFAWGGRKDRHAATQQTVTIHTEQTVDISAPGYRLAPIGRALEPMGPQHIRGNHFRIRLREVPVVGRDRAAAFLRGLPLAGFENYFDDQRFAGTDPRLGFPGKMMLLGHFNGALKSFLTRPDPDGKAEDRERKDFFYDHWKEWKPCLAEARRPLEKRVFAHLASHPRDFSGAVNLISREEISMALSAWQSFVWNRCLAELVRELAGSGVPALHQGVCGPYLFLRNPFPAASSYLAAVSIPTCGVRPQAGEERIIRILQAVLADEGVAPNAFKKFQVNGVYLKSTLRPVIVRPEAFHWEWQDVASEMRFGELRLQFLLPRGSYATMLLKRLGLELG